MALNIPSFNTRLDALRWAYIENEKGNLKQEHWDYLLGKWGIEETDLDEIEYVGLDDNEIENAKEAGKESAREATGNGGKTWDDITLTATTGVTSAVGLGFSFASCGGVTLGGLFKGGGFFKNLGKALGKGSGKANSGTMAIVALALAVATAIMHLVCPGTKDSKKALETLQGTLAEGNEAMNDAQGDMQDMANRIRQQQAEAEAANEDGQYDINKLASTTSLDAIRLASYDKRVANGEELTDEEKAWCEAARARIEANKTEINKVSQGITDTVGSISADIYANQATYEEIQVTTQEIAGIVEFTANLDETTRTLATINKYASIANIASAAIAGVRMFSLGPWGYLGIAVAAGVATMEGFAIKEHLNTVNVANTTIKTRIDAGELNQVTIDMVDTEIKGNELVRKEVDALNHVKTTDDAFENLK